MRNRVLFLVLVVVPLTAVGIAVAAGAFDGAKSATARFHDLDKAEAAGYAKFPDAAGIECIASPGVHYVNGGLVGDAVLDPTRPEALVYQPKPDGGLRLVALEYIVFKHVWEEAGPSEPAVDVRAAVRLYGQPESVRDSALLRAPRVDLEAEPERHPRTLEPAGRLLTLL
jgi:hypothetical protein